MQAKERGAELLRELGLNALEAEVYAFLLASEPVTAYAIGTAISKPTANVYKAIERLARAGAVLVEEGANRLCRAVPVREFLRHTERQFQAVKREAEEVLGSLQKDSTDERVYRVESVAEALERCREMLARAKVVAVVDAFPRALDAIAPAIVAAARRGVKVWVEAYRPIDLPGAEIALVPDGELSVAAWQSQQLNVVVDGREHLLALLSDDLREVHQAVWSKSVYLSCVHHGGRMHEIAFIRLMNNGASVDAGSLGAFTATPSSGKERLPRNNKDGVAPAPLASGDAPFFRNHEVPGHRELVRRFGRKS